MAMIGAGPNRPGAEDMNEPYDSGWLRGVSSRSDHQKLWMGWQVAHSS